MVRGNELSARRLLVLSVVVVSKRYAYDLSFVFSHFPICLQLCFNVLITYAIHRLLLSCCGGLGYFHHDIEAQTHVSP